MTDLDRVDFYREVLGGKGKKEGEGIPVGFEGIFPTALYAGKILMEELIDTA